MTTPANGTAFVGLLIGGNEDILRALRGDLYDEFGIEIRNQWQNAREFCPVPPRGTDVILILTDFSAHGMSRDAVKIAKANKIRYALIGRKKSAWLNGLNTCGFVHRPSWLKPARKEPTKMEAIVKPAALVLTTNGAAKVAPVGEVLFTASDMQPPERYIPLPRKWLESDMATVYRLAEEWKPTNPPGSLEDDADRFAIDVWRRIGTYRTTSVLRLRCDAMRALVNIPPALLVALSRSTATVHRAKMAHLEKEREALKGPRSQWPAYVSVDAVLTRIGPRYRMGTVKAVFDRLLGMPVYPRTDFVRVLESLEKRGLTPDANGLGRTPLEWEQHILATLKIAPGARSRLGIHRASDKRGHAALRALVSAGAVLESPLYGVAWYRLPEHDWPPPPRKFVGRVAKPKPKPITVVAPPVATPASMDMHRELRADVYRAMRAGEINAKDAAELLRQLAKGA